MSALWASGLGESEPRPPRDLNSENSGVLFPAWHNLPCDKAHILPLAGITHCSRTR